MPENQSLPELVFGVLETAQPGEFDAEPPIAGLTLETIRALPEAEQTRLMLELARWGAEHKVPKPIDAPNVCHGDLSL